MYRTNCSLDHMMMLEEKSEDHQSYDRLSCGEHELVVNSMASTSDVSLKNVNVKVVLDTLELHLTQEDSSSVDHE